MKISVTLILLSLFFSLQSSAIEVPANCDFYFKTQNLCASLEWLTQPVHMKAGSFRLSFSSVPNAASVGAKLFMPGMGHGGGLVTVNPTLDPKGNVILGEFDATNVSFMMAGAWQISVQLKDQSGAVLDAAQIDYQAQ